MDIINKNRFFFWLSVFLAVINIATITVFWVSYSDVRRNKPVEKDNSSHVKDFLIKELNFTDSQRSTLERMLLDYRRESATLRNGIHDYHCTINSRILQNTNPADIQLKIDTLGIMKAKLDMLTYKFFYELFRMCNEEQKIRYIQLFMEIDKMMVPGPVEKQ